MSNELSNGEQFGAILPWNLSRKKDPVFFIFYLTVLYKFQLSLCD